MHACIQRLVQQAMEEAYEHRHSHLREVKLTLKLVFKSQPQLPIHKDNRITDTKGDPLEIVLVDVKTGSPCALPMELEIQLFPLQANFLPYKDWSAKDFHSAIVKTRISYVPLLHGDYRRTMTDGRVTVHELEFTDDSSWVLGRMFRIGACVMPSSGYDGTVRIIEAITEEAFVVQDISQKHYPPVLSDSVCRLEMIDKNRDIHRRLIMNNVRTVRDFLSMLNVKTVDLQSVSSLTIISYYYYFYYYNIGQQSHCAFSLLLLCCLPPRKQLIVGEGEMTTTEAKLRWEKMTSHAIKCDYEYRGNVYAYSGANGHIYVDCVFNELLKVEIHGVDCPLQQLDKAQTVCLLDLASPRNPSLARQLHETCCRV